MAGSAAKLQLRVARRILRTPRPILAALLAGRRKTYRGAELDPTAHLMLGMLRRSGRREVHELGLPAARRAVAVMSAPFEVEHVECATEDVSLDGIPARIYRGGSSEAPAMLFFHGGGFVVSSVDTYDRVCRYIAATARATVVSVDYRLAPEHPYPAGHDDARRALEVATGGAVSASKWMVAGDSAGGTLAAIAAQHAHDRGIDLAFQYLVYPATDLVHDTDSIRELRDGGYLLTRELMAWFGDQLKVGDARTTDRASPGRREDCSGLCQTKIVTAGFDPLSDEAIAYVERLRAAGVRVEHTHYASSIHGFVSFAALFPEGREVLDDMARTLRGLS